jgi:hypothetical protein
VHEEFLNESEAWLVKAPEGAVRWGAVGADEIHDIHGSGGIFGMGVESGVERCGNGGEVEELSLLIGDGVSIFHEDIEEVSKHAVGIVRSRSDSG